jgi:hypothetical protein
VVVSPLTFKTLLMEICYCVQLDRLGKEFIVPLEKQISSEQGEKQEVVEKQAQEIVGQKRRASSASTEMVAAGGTRRSKRVKVAPTRYVTAEEESLEGSPHDSSVATMHFTLTASSSATDVTSMVVIGSNEDANTVSSEGVSAVAAATMVHKERNARKPFDERFKDLMAFKAEFGNFNVPQTWSRDNKHLSLGRWCSGIRRQYKTLKEGGATKRYKLSKANIQRLENAGFELGLLTNTKLTFDERFKELIAFKAEFGHCTVPKSHPLWGWNRNIRRSYRAIQGGRGKLQCKLSKANIKRLENAGFEWCPLTKSQVNFNKRFKELMSFKAEFGHYKVPKTRSRNNTHLSLGIWCNDIRQSYKAIEEGRTPIRKLSKDYIQRLENAGFKWRLS